MRTTTITCPYCETRQRVEVDTNNVDGSYAQVYTCDMETYAGCGAEMVITFRFEIHNLIRKIEGEE